jgi:hypothetical protein
MRERLISKALDPLARHANTAGSLATATLATLTLVACGPQTQRHPSPAKPPEPTEELAAYVNCLPHTKPTVQEVVPPKDLHVGTIGFTCVDPKKGPLAPPALAADVAPSDREMPSRQALGVNSTAKEFIFKFVSAAPTGLQSSEFTVHPPEGSTPFAFIELSGITTLEGPLAAPARSAPSMLGEPL